MLIEHEFKGSTWHFACLVEVKWMTLGWLAQNVGLQRGQTVQYAAPQIIQQPIAYSVQQPKSKGIAFILNFLIPGIVICISKTLIVGFL